MPVEEIFCIIFVGRIPIWLQKENHGEIPLRIMEYDATNYRNQISEIKRKIREEQKNKKSDEKLKAGEYMYGFKKTSQLHPVTTIVLYAGVEPWDGPENLSEIIDFTDIPDTMKELVQDYKIKVVDIRRLNDTGMFKTDVRHVFEFIKYAERKTELYNLVSNDSYYQEMDEDAYEVVEKYANIKEGTVKIEETIPILCDSRLKTSIVSYSEPMERSLGHGNIENTWKNGKK